MLERLVVAVTFDERRGYVATGPAVATVTALSLSSLRKRIEAQLPPTEEIKLELDRVARRERDRRRTVQQQRDERNSQALESGPGLFNTASWPSSLQPG
jgi:hypothetical protein